jgi:protein required for attachment to host cells
MNRKIAIPHDARVLVGDGRKALILRNQGDDLYPNLQVEHTLENADNPATHLQGSDRPGRVLASGTRRSAVEETDRHEMSEERFAKTIIEALEQLRARNELASLVIVAPPRMLAQLRAGLPDAIKSLVSAEIDRDLTKTPVHEIEKHLTAR